MTSAPWPGAGLHWLVITGIFSLASFTNCANAQKTWNHPCTDPWPNCARRCLRCRAKPVGSCWVNLLTKWEAIACKEAKGPTQCFLGSCMCDIGYCANVQERTCEKQLCIEGTLAPPYEPSMWATVWSALAVGGSIEVADLQKLSNSTAEEVKDGVIDIIRTASYASYALLFFGVLVALFTTICLCIPGETDVEIPSGKDFDEDASDGDFFGHSRGPRVMRSSDQLSPPSSFPMLICALATFFILVISWVARERAWLETRRIIESKFTSLDDDLDAIVDAAVLINETAVNLEIDLMRAIDSCKVVPSPLRAAVQSQTQGVIRPYLEQVEQYTAMLRPLPELYDEAHIMVRSLYPLIEYCPLLPSIVVGVLSLLMIAEALLTALAGHSSLHHLSTLARCEDWGLRLSSLFLAFIMLAIALFTAVELEATIVAGKFCSDVDTNVMGLAAQQSAPEVYNLTRHYLVGDVDHPMELHEETIHRYVLSVLELWDRLTASPLASTCSDLDDIKVRETARRAKQIWGMGRRLLDASNIYPIYTDIVHRGVCGSILQALGSVVICQTCVCLMCFPVCAILTHRFISRWADWKALTDEPFPGIFDERTTDESE